MTKISVIVPVYNGEKHIKRCIKSISSQTFKNLELLVVNDGSTDATLEILKTIKEERMKIINKENAGVSSARNAGLEKAKGDYILFFDADDYMEENMLEIMIKDMEQNDVQAVRCNNYIYYEDIETKKKSQEYLFYGNHRIVDRDVILEDAISGKIMAFSHSMLFKRFKNTIRYNEEIEYMEDVIFYVSALKEIQKIYIEPKPLYNYVQTSNSATRNQNKILKNLKSLSKYNTIIKKELELNSFYTQKRAKMIDTRNTILVSDLLSQYKYNDLSIREAKEIFKQIFENQENINFLNNYNKDEVCYYKAIIIKLGKKHLYFLLYLYIRFRKICSRLKK